MIKAKYIGHTFSGHNSHLNRWEYPKCKADPNKAECRFNLDHKKIRIWWKCRFCKTKLWLAE